jgi:hypothetical protein
MALTKIANKKEVRAGFLTNLLRVAAAYLMILDMVSVLARDEDAARTFT